MERVVLPFSGLASWVLILGGILATLQVLGINIQPLLTVGGVSGIVVGLSAQSVMSNMISGINLVSRMVTATYVDLRSADAFTAYTLPCMYHQVLPSFATWIIGEHC